MRDLNFPRYSDLQRHPFSRRRITEETHESPTVGIISNNTPPPTPLPDPHKYRIATLLIFLFVFPLYVKLLQRKGHEREGFFQ